MMKEELEKRLHNIAELLYEQGFDDGKEKGIEITQKKQIRFMYEQGLNDTWECIRKFRNLSEKERERIFDTIWLQDILCHFKPLEFVQKIKEYEERQKQDEKSCINCLYALNETYSETCRKCVTCEEDHFEPKQTDATDMNDGSIKVGDEVRIKGSDPVRDDCDYGICTRSLPKINTIYVMRRDGSSGEENKNEWYRTGRHFPQIAEVLEQLRGEEE